VFNQRIHRAQQLLMGDLLNALKGRKAYCVQPSQHTQLGVCIAKSVKHHYPQQGFKIDAVAAYLPKRIPQAMQA
jgi:hypothetical protein